MIRKRIFLSSLAVGFALLVTYVGTFAIWWHNSPTHVITENGRATRYTDFHMTPFRWKTRVLWAPAFLWIEHVSGYRYISEAPAEHLSIYTYAK